MFMPFTVTQGSMFHFMTVSLIIWLGCNQLMIWTSLSLLVMPMIITEWLDFVSPTDRHGRDAFDFCNLSGCEQLVCCHNQIDGNRLDLVMTDVLDIVDVVVGTPLGSSND